MLIVLTSRDAVAPNSVPRTDVVAALISASNGGNPTGIVSNHAAPSWFASHFSGSRVSYVPDTARQNGSIVRINAQKFGLKSYDTLVLAANREDIQMGKNGGAVLVGAGWSGDSYVASLGIAVPSPGDLDEVLKLSGAWQGAWWFDGAEARYSIRALSDLSSLNASWTQRDFSTRITTVVKQGGPKLMSLLTITARSLLVAQLQRQRNLMWGVYPASSSANNDSEVLSDFAHRLRTTVSSVRMAKKGEPLFIRHTPSTKRSKTPTANRTDPTEQLETLHLNPFYRSKIHGRNVVVVDDCVTHGVSFAVAAAFLRKAGAASVTGMALGKFGGALKYYEIDVHADPFRPLTQGQYAVSSPRTFSGATNPVAQQALRDLLT